MRRTGGLHGRTGECEAAAVMGSEQTCELPQEVCHAAVFLVVLWSFSSPPLVTLVSKRPRKAGFTGMLCQMTHSKLDQAP